MKKLLAMMTAVALGTFAWGDATDFAPGQSFNDMTPGAFTTNMEDGFWSGTADKTTVSGVEYTYSKESAEKFGNFPAEFSDAGKGNSLAVHTPLNAPLYRSVVSGGAAQAMAGGFYFDSVVHFTACDAEAEVPADAKLAVWLQDMTEAEPAQAVTNLMITAGYFSDADNTIVQKIYNCGDFAKFGLANGDDWCRLTVKAIDEIGDGNNRSGFVVFVNGVAAQHADSIGVAGSVVDSLNAQAAQWNTGKQLFPSLIANAATISAVGFAGQGGVDDISFTRTAPSFAQDFAFYTVAWQEGVTGFKAGDVTKTDLTGAGSVQVVWDGEVKPVISNITYADGKMAAGLDETVPGTTTIKVADLGAKVKINDVETSYATAADAVAAINKAGAVNAVLALCGDATAGITLDNADANVVLDLAGKTITAGESDTEAIFVNSGTLTITNTTEMVGVVVAKGDTQSAVANASGEILITAGVYDGFVSVDDEWTVATGGKFSTSYNTASNLAAPTGYEFVKDDAENPQYWVLQEITTTYVAQIGEKQYETFAEAFEAAADGDTITLLDNATTDVITKFKNNLTINLGGFTLTADLAADSKYIFQILKDLNVTFKNGKIAVAAAKTSLTTVFQNYANLTVEDVEIDAANLTGSNAYWNCAAVFAIMNGNVQITGSTTIKNNAGYAVSIGNHAGDYPSRAVTINTTGTLDGDFLFAGGTVTYTAGSFASDAKYYYGLAVQATNDVGTVTNGSMFAGSDLVNFPIVAGVGAPVVYPDPATKTAYYEKLGQLFATVADANAAIAETAFAKNIIVFKNATADALSVASGTVNVVIPADVTLTATTSLALNDAKVALAEGGTLVAPAALTIASDFVAPATGKEIKVTGEGPYTYTVGDAAPQGVVPGTPVSIGEGSMTAEAAAAAAAKLTAAPTADQQAAGITAADLQVKAEFIGGAWLAVAEPADKFVPVIKTAATKPIEVTDTAFKATINNAKPGFYYGFVRAATVDGTYAPAAAFVSPKAAGDLTLEAPKASGTQGFYKLSVSAVPVTPVVK